MAGEQRQASPETGERSSRLRRAWAFARRSVFREERLWKVLLVLGGLFRVWQIIFFRGPMDHVFSDAGRHLDNGRHFLTPGPMGCSNAYFYQLFLYVVVTLTKEKRIWVHLVHAVLSAAYPYLWYRFAREVTKRRVTALRFAALLTFLPTHAVIFQFFFNETIILPLLGAALWASAAAARRRSAWRFILAAVLWTCAVLTRSVTLPLAVVVLAYALYHYQRELPRRRWRPALGVVGASIMAGGLWIAAQHSLRIFEYATPFGDATWLNIAWVASTKEFRVSFTKPKSYTFTYGFSSPSFYISPFDPFYDWHSFRKGNFVFSTNVETHGEDLKQIFRQQLKLHRKVLPRLVLENLIFLTFGHAWPESGKSDLLGKVCLQERWIWFPTISTAMIWSLVFMYRRRRLHFLPAIVVLATGVLYSAQIVVMEGRYRKPIEPLVILALFWLFEARRASRRAV